VSALFWHTADQSSAVAPEPLFGGKIICCRGFLCIYTDSISNVDGSSDGDYGALQYSDCGGIGMVNQSYHHAAGVLFLLLGRRLVAWYTDGKFSF